MLVILTMTYAKKVLVMASSKIINRGHESDYKGGVSQGNIDLEAGPLWCGHVWVTPVVL